MYFPTGDQLRDVITNFETCWGFPQTVGAIDGTHTYQLFVHKRVPLNTTIRKATTLFMQVVVDYRRLFIDAYIGWPGKVHDAWVLVNSSDSTKYLTCHLKNTLNIITCHRQLVVTLYLNNLTLKTKCLLFACPHWLANFTKDDDNEGDCIAC